MFVGIHLDSVGYTLYLDQSCGVFKADILCGGTDDRMRGSYKVSDQRVL
jgi:hypothetical protein